MICYVHFGCVFGVVMALPCIGFTRKALFLSDCMCFIRRFFSHATFARYGLSKVQWVYSLYSFGTFAIPWPRPPRLSQSDGAKVLGCQAAENYMTPFPFAQARACLSRVTLESDMVVFPLSI